ncbi:MAG: hypothetical protein M9894_36835 [Planctomycetes bacterium]|nr:hypothetical protein [Planctomycetota bacterium]
MSSSIGRGFPEEHEARRLRDVLAASLGPEVEVVATGEGVHWHIDAQRGGRRVRLHVFDYGRDGFEYAHEFHAGAARVGSGRTREQRAVLEAVRAWVLESRALADVWRVAPFVDERKRALSALAATLNRALVAQGSSRRSQLLPRHGGDDPFHELWLYAPDRSCRMGPDQGGIPFALRWRSTDLASGVAPSPDDLARLVIEWLDRQARATALTGDFPFLSLAECARAYEEGRFLDWTWALLGRRAQDLESTLGRFHGSLVPLLAEREGPRGFYVFTSLTHLCFSRSSAYPFDTRGLPVVSPTTWDRGERYAVTVDGREVLTGDPATVADRLDAILLPGVGRSFQGSLEDVLQEEVNAALAARGARSRVAKVQIGEWFRHVAQQGDRAVAVSRSREPHEDRADLLEGLDGSYADAAHRCERLEPARRLDRLDAASCAAAVVEWLE